MIEINNLTEGKISSKFLKKIIEFVLKGEKKKGDISLAIVDSSRIKELNKQYRKKNKATDVLSFLAKNQLDDKFNAGENYLGEIVICPEYIKEKNKEAGLVFKKGLTRALIHSVLHLLEYDHEKSKSKRSKMEERERFFFKRI
ncbi:MAG: rRNA maturation RNase YbeY [Candidatus Parcubacteria bacterium]|nr:rRNA maturation RNase YbeY [Candidatus Parcubacteria bacterium]